MAEQQLADPFDLQRFVDAQEHTYAAARTELAAGAKRSHWMWFIFPQLAGLGRSPTAQRYAIDSLEEARAYLAHPILGARLLECAALVASVNGRSANEILGSPDDVKLRSSMTLFAARPPTRSSSNGCSSAILVASLTRERSSGCARCSQPVGSRMRHHGGPGD